MHTAHRHGRTITITGTGRRRTRLRIITRHPQLGNLDRGHIYCAGIRDGRPVWQPVTPDAEYLDEVVGDFVDAERALLDATSGLDEILSQADLDAWAG